MANSSQTPSAADLVDDGALGLAAGLGILTMTLFPLAIPLLALTAAALIPLLLLPLILGLIAAPFLLLRWLFRHAANAVRAEAPREPSSYPSPSHPTPRGRPGRAARCDA
jgi:hypothetical protein